MAARPGMTDLISDLRLKTDTSPDEVSVNGVSYWTDDQLQDILDQHRQDVDVQLVAYPRYESGELLTKIYYIPNKVLTTLENDPSVLEIVDRYGNAATGYTVDLSGRKVTFDADTGGTAYWLRGRQFDVDYAAADVWAAKASHRAALVDWRAGGQTLYEDQEYQHCLEREKFYRGKRLSVSRLVHSGYFNG